MTVQVLFLAGTVIALLVIATGVVCNVRHALHEREPSPGGVRLTFVGLALATATSGISLAALIPSSQAAAGILLVGAASFAAITVVVLWIANKAARIVRRE